jgi:hypothetical protein
MPEWLHYTGLAISVLIFTWFLAQVASSVKSNGKAISKVFDKVEDLDKKVLGHAKECDMSRAITEERVSQHDGRLTHLEAN